MPAWPTTHDQSLQDILSRHYPFAVVAEDDGWSIIFPDLPGCTSFAQAWGEIGTQAEDALASWVESSLEEGHPIPEPSSDWNPINRSPEDFIVPTLTVDDAARELGVSPRRVQALAASRKIGRRFGRSLMFIPQDLVDLKPGAPGRPRKPPTSPDEIP